jgi:MFS transporter, AAHS family, 4-hydroxybenzoate transporter
MDTKRTFSVSSVLDSFGVNRFTWFMFFVLGFAMVFDGYDYMIVSYTLKKIAAGWGLSTVATGSLSSWSLFGLIIGGAISGIVSDRIGRKKTLVAAIFIYSLLTIPQAFSPSFAFFATFRVLAGIGLGACIPVVTTCFAESTPTNKRSLFITFGMAWMIVGWVLAGIIGRGIANFEGQIIAGLDNWRICYLIGGIPLLYSILLMFIMKETPHWYANKGRSADAVARLAQIEKMALGKVTERDPASLVTPPAPKKSGPAALFSKQYLVATMAIWSTYFIGCFIVYGLNAWLPAMMSANFGDKVGATLATYQNGAAVIANCSVGFIAEVIGRKKNLIVGFIVTIAAILLTSWVVQTFSTAFGLTLAVMIFLGFAVNYTITAVQPLMAESYPTEFRNTGISWCQAFGRFGGALSPIIMGMVLVATGNNHPQAFLFLAFPAFLGLLAAIFLVKRETKGKSLEELQSESEAAA